METNILQKQCKHCKEMINKDAKRCPKCHWDLRSWASRHPLLATVLFIILFSGIIGSMSEDDNTSPSSTSTTIAEKTTQQKEFEDIKSKIQINAYVKDEYGFAHAFLKVTNNTGHPIDLFSFQAKLFNNADELQKQSISMKEYFSGQSQETLLPWKTVTWQWQLVGFESATKIGNIEIKQIHFKDTGKNYE